MADERARIDEFEARSHEIHNHPARLEHLALKRLHLSIEAVFAPNWAELVQLLEEAAKNEQLAIELIQNVRAPRVREQFNGLLLRRLHNYLAGVTTLVDHTRRIVAERPGPTADDFERRKQRVNAEPELPFIKELRNFTLHRTLPFVGHVLKLEDPGGDGQQFESEVQLSATDLLSWDGWSEPSRRLIGHAGNDLRIRPIIQRHGELVLELNSWLLNELQAANAEGLAELNELIARFRGDMGYPDPDDVPAPGPANP